MEHWNCEICKTENKIGHNVGIVLGMTKENNKKFDKRTICIKCHNKGYDMELPR